MMASEKTKENLSSDNARLLHAAQFAAERHWEQKRKDVRRTPYINHPIEVAALLADAGGVTDVELLSAALLHDTVEDTETSPEEIGEAFGAAVRTLVAEVTDDKSLPKARRKELQVENGPHKSDRAKQLKLADKICNIRSIDADSPAGWECQRKTEYLDWSVRVIAGCRGVNLALERLFDQTLTAARRRLE
jgi:(p)ppGpp synthase/HD superfamily hydrolase